MSNMSSLQRALSNYNPKNGKKTSSNKIDGSGGRGGGAFESSFAKGLDLTELLSSFDGQSNRTSAAEELLKIKEAERRQRQLEEQEEVKLQQALEKRLHSLQNNANKGKEATTSSFEIGDALLRMHGSDDKTASILSRKSTKSRKNNTRVGGAKQTASNKANKKPLVAKKSRRSKF
mmetsp:Transcript_17024/g.39092  ORF Transcript_17024/g.39092 Transcript_17024/m.39092 type:complete len:176 (+) Transcript_17024:196-723(+)